MYNPDHYGVSDNPKVIFLEIREVLRGFGTTRFSCCGAAWCAMRWLEVSVASTHTGKDIRCLHIAGCVHTQPPQLSMTDGCQ